MSQLRELRAFVLLCVIWGSTWIAIKVALDAVPPLFLAGSRFAVAGGVLIAFESLRSSVRVQTRDWIRIAITSLAIITLCYGLLFWGMLFVDSGTAAVIEMGLTPIALLGFAVLAGDERASIRKLLAIALGLLGLGFLFGPNVAIAWTAPNGQATAKVIGSLAIAGASIVYAWGSVLSRALLRTYPATLVSGLTTFMGGLLLLCASFALEPEAMGALHGNWGIKAWAGWLFLIVAGSLVGYSIYMRLLRDIGSSRAGMYAFVSPVVAVLFGAVLLGERVTGPKVAGMAILLAATWLALSDRNSSDVSEAARAWERAEI